MRKPPALLIATMFAFVLTALGATAQDNEKVIKTTTDSRGFETRHTEVDLMIQTAKALMDAKQWAKAAEELEKVMTKDSSRLDALHDLGNCYKNLEQYDKAAAAYSKAVMRNPDDERLLINLAYYQVRSKDVEGAEKSYLKLLEVNPNSYEANKGLGYLYEKTGQQDKAIKSYQEAVRIQPSDYKSMGSIAKMYEEAGQEDKAMAEYEKLIDTAPEDVALDYKAEVGRMYIKQQNFTKSAWIFDDLVKAQPDNYTHRYNYGISLIQIKRQSDAVPQLEKALELKPDFCPTYRMLAGAYEATGRYSDAIKTVQSGLDTCGKDQAGLYYEWGRALEGLSRYEDAILKFELATADATFGEAAKKQIKRQQDLIKRKQALENQ